jgi:hydrogenase expression/formation protein HypD
VTREGNTKAQQILDEIFEPADAGWRGIGVIPQSGLKIREKYAAYDAQKLFDVEVPDAKTPRGCACGEILIGTKTPPECALYKKVCTPMVSTEGTCAAYYKYHSD